MSGELYELVLANGRVVDPESGLDSTGNVGISDGTIRYVGDRALTGSKEVDVKGMVVSPGFIDLHSHGQDSENYAVQARDGVTSALELEVGTADVAGWYEAREGTAAINYGVSAGHLPVRMKVMKDPGDMIPVSDGAHREASLGEIDAMKELLAGALKEGAIAAGFGIQYAPATSWWEVLEMFAVAARYGAVCHVHMRGQGEIQPIDSIQGLSELIAASAITGAGLHVVHLNSSGEGAVPRLLSLIDDARSRGMDVTTECYPYTASMSPIESALYDDGWQEVMGRDYGDLEWPKTGERLTQSSFARYREEGGMVIEHGITPEEMIPVALASDIMMIASDGLVRDGKGHPRTAGTYSRILGRHVRESGHLSLMDAIRKMSLLPAQRLEALVPEMKDKGRIREGADADLVVFDPDTVIDRSTYAESVVPPLGIAHVVVNGTLVVEDGSIRGERLPGRPIRAGR
jgi:N-acyl-D-aspartate/D-glutamate deacylase